MRNEASAAAYASTVDVMLSALKQEACAINVEARGLSPCFRHVMFLTNKDWKTVQDMLE